MADVIVFVYDSSDTNSFSYISNLRQQYSAIHSLPSIFVATKSDLDLVQQRHEVQPEVYCSKLGLRIPTAPLESSSMVSSLAAFGAHSSAGPVHVSVKLNEVADVFGIICQVAQDPRNAIPGGAHREKSLMGLLRKRWLLYVGVAVLGGGMAIAFVGLCYPSHGRLGSMLDMERFRFRHVIQQMSKTSALSTSTSEVGDTSNRGWLAWFSNVTPMADSRSEL